MPDHITTEWIDKPDHAPGTRMFRAGHSGEWAPWVGDPIPDGQFAKVVTWKDGTLYLESIEPDEEE